MGSRRGGQVEDGLVKMRDRGELSRDANPADIALAVLTAMGLMKLGADLAQAWSRPAATMATRKRIVRAVLNETVVRVADGYIDLVLHWQGGDHTPLKVKKNTSGKYRWTADEETEVLIRELARLSQPS